MESQFDAQSTLTLLREKLAERGATTTQSIGRIFRQIDSYNGNKKVDAEEFRVGMQELGLSLTAAQVRGIFSLIDENHDGNMTFDEFLVGLRGSLNNTRREVCDRAFAKFDKDGSGVIETADMRGIYSAKRHPKVVSGEKTEEQVFREFLAVFGDKDGDGKISKHEWYDYYGNVSSSVDTDA